MSTRRTISLDERDTVLYTNGAREALHAAVRQLYEHAKTRVGAAPDLVDAETGEVTARVWRLTFGESEDDRTVKQNRFYWGVVLPQISKQAPGQWTADAWHEAFKREVLGYEVIRVKVAGRKRATVYRRLRSTTDLTVKQMSEYLDEIIATATTDLGVTFEFDQQEREAVRYVRPARKKPTKQLEVA
jgi:hypothetical protein